MRRRTKARAWKGVNSIEGKENEKKKCAQNIISNHRRKIVQGMEEEQDEEEHKKRIAGKKTEMASRQQKSAYLRPLKENHYH